ncbi:MAG: alpha/beta fold hydrolase [Gemmatimonadales bacterium]|nr:alpha/beta fold hydrolase [Gemmatimonadales bacterium]NIN51273.1 alpha/beta fold hydrolase [Gemmatimonadales bacterium]NIP08737.1 alpha/beta fold hydrolase [Gemmatimonadales bacterium]NIS67236.1 alpha/beta fold hydrolase [Gemmatimonadales bacterium]
MRSEHSGWRLLAAVVMTVAVCRHAAGQAPPLTEREVTFRNGAVELRGTLMLPAAGGPFPAVVFLHGSGPHTREGFRPYAEEFARLGLASLFFDKRGSGESGGSWITASLEDLAGDALAAVHHLRTEEAIDPDRIGFWGVSQAGWVAPLAASPSEEIAFMIVISGGGASPRESELFSYEQQFERAKLTPAQKSQARELLRAYFEYLATGRQRAELIARLDEIRAGPLGPLAEQLDRILPSEENRPNWSWVATHDPAPYIERLTCPLLLLFGERDTDHPTALALERWREGLRKARNDRVTLMVFPGAGHGIRMREGHSGGGRAPFADGYLEVQLGWLWRHVIVHTR